jgi:hypothetical protein
VTVPEALAALGPLCQLLHRVEEKTVLSPLRKRDARRKEILMALQVHLRGQSM